MTVIPIARGHARAKLAYRTGLNERFGDINSFLPAFVIHLQARGEAKKTIEKKLTVVDQLSEFLGNPDVSAVSRADIERFQVSLLATMKRSSVSTKLIALRSFFAYLALDLGDYPSPMDGLTVPKSEDPLVEPVPAELVAAMIFGCEKKRDKEWEDIRDAALLRIFVDSGARLSEVTNLTLADILPLDNGRMMLRVWGKGRGGGPRERHVPIGAKAGVALRRYLRARAAHPHAASSRLWLGRKGPINPHGVREMIYRRSEAAGQRIHPHQLRHSWAVAMKSTDMRDGDICHLAGWVDGKMLGRYGKTKTAERATETYWAQGAPGDSIG